MTISALPIPEAPGGNNGHALAPAVRVVSPRQGQLRTMHVVNFVNFRGKYGGHRVTQNHRHHREHV